MSGERSPQLHSVEKRNLILHYKLSWMTLCSKHERVQHRLLPTFMELKSEIKAAMHGKSMYSYAELRVLLNLLDRHLQIIN